MTMTPEEVKAFLMGDSARMGDSTGPRKDSPAKFGLEDQAAEASGGDYIRKPVLSADAMNNLLADVIGQVDEEPVIQNHHARALGWRIIPRSDS